MKMGILEQRARASARALIGLPGEMRLHIIQAIDTKQKPHTNSNLKQDTSTWHAENRMMIQRKNCIPGKKERRRCRWKKKRTSEERHPKLDKKRSRLDWLTSRNSFPGFDFQSRNTLLKTHGRIRYEDGQISSLRVAQEANGFVIYQAHIRE